MAEILKTFSFRTGKTGTYPWGEWFDGKIRRLTRGTDFRVSVSSLRGAVHQAAERHGVKIRTTTDGDALVIQATPRNGVNGKKK